MRGPWRRAGAAALVFAGVLGAGHGLGESAAAADRVLPSLPALGGAAHNTAPGSTRALVVGINAYRHITPLNGAVNDARIIADALKAGGIQDVTILLDQQVSRDSLLAAWNAVLERSQPGDVLLFTYAGHGSQLPERVPGSETDHKDEIFLLTQFSTAAPDNYDRIIDDEIGDLLRRAKGRTVIFIADSCHSGTVTRAFDPRATQHRTRFTNVGPIEDDMLPPPPSPSPPSAAGGTTATAAPSAEGPGDGPDLSHVLFVAGVDEDKLVPEVTIDNQSHGALSYSVAHALMGEADRDGDGHVTVAEFQAFVRQGVRVHTDGRQAIRMDRGADVSTTRTLMTVSQTGGGAAIAAVPAMSLPTTPAPVTLYVMTDGDVAGSLGDATRGMGEGASVGLSAGASITLVDTPADADLVWDVGTGALVSSLGDVVATLPPDTPEAQRDAVRRVAAKWGVIKTLKGWPESKRLSVDLAPDNSLHHVGETVTLTVSGQTLPYLTLINLDPFGGLNRVFPVPDLGDVLDAYANGRSMDLSMDVYLPVGGDHFIALATEHPPLALHQALASLDGHPVDAEGLLTLLHQAIEGQRHELGIHGVFTAL